MRVSLRFLLMLVPSLAVVVLGFITAMDKLEHKWMLDELNRRSLLVSESLQEDLVDALTAGRSATTLKLLNRIARDSCLQGVTLCSVEGNIIGKSTQTPRAIGCQGMSSLAAREPGFLSLDGESYHRAVYAVLADGKLRGYVLLLKVPLTTSRTEALSRVVTLLLAFLPSCCLSRWSLFWCFVGAQASGWSRSVKRCGVY